MVDTKSGTQSADDRKKWPDPQPGPDPTPPKPDPKPEPEPVAKKTPAKAKPAAKKAAKAAGIEPDPDENLGVGLVEHGVGLGRWRLEDGPVPDDDTTVVLVTPERGVDADGMPL